MLQFCVLLNDMSLVIKRTFFSIYFEMFTFGSQCVDDQTTAI